MVLMAAFLKSILCDCCGLGAASSPNSERVRSSFQARSIYQQEPKPHVDSDVVRQNAASAAEARMKSQESRGVKNNESFRRLQERQAKIDKATEDYERKGGDATQETGMRWQMD